MKFIQNGINEYALIEKIICILIFQLGFNNYSPNYSAIFIHGKFLKVDTLLIVDAFKLFVKIINVPEVILPINNGHSY